MAPTATEVELRGQKAAIPSSVDFSQFGIELGAPAMARPFHSLLGLMEERFDGDQSLVG